MSKFEKLYANVLFEIFGDSNIYYNVNDFIKDFSNEKKEDLQINKIVIFYEFSSLKQLGFEDIKYKNFIDVIFQANECCILTNYKANVFEIPYGTELTDNEIDKIVKSEIKRHKEFIEQKIAEKESK